MWRQGESKGRGRREAMLMIYTRCFQTNMLFIWTCNSSFNGMSLPHIWTACAFTCPTAFSSDPSNHSPWIQMCRQSDHSLFSNLCPWPMAIGFFSLFPPEAWMTNIICDVAFEKSTWNVLDLWSCVTTWQCWALWINSTCKLSTTFPSVMLTVPIPAPTSYSLFRGHILSTAPLDFP